MADYAVGQVNQPGQDATPGHQIPSHDKERNGHQGEGVNAAEHQGRKDIKGHAFGDKDEGDASKAQTKGYRNA